MIGVDASGKRPLGKVSRETFRGKAFDFLPVLHYPEDKAREAAKSLKDSINFQFLQGLIRHLPAVRRVLKEVPTSVDLQTGRVRHPGQGIERALHPDAAW